MAQRTREPQRADAALAEAIRLAAPLGALRPLVGGGREVADLLSRSMGTFGHHEDFAAHWDGSDRGPLLLECTRRGVFAVGDVRRGSTKRVAAAVGDGALVVRSIHASLGERSS